MISFEMFKEMINLIHTTDIEMHTFNKEIEKLFGSDTYSMYYTPLTIVENYVITVLQTEFNESKEGAELFIDEGLSQIKRGGTSIEENGKIWDIKNIKDYYDYLVSLQM